MSVKEILARLWNLIASFRMLLILSFCLAVVSVILNLYAPLLIGDMIDAISAKQDASFILQDLVFLIVVYISYSFTNWGMMLCTNHIAYASSYTLRKQLFHKMKALPISFYDTHGHGDLMSRFTNDIDMISDGLLQGLSTLLSGIVTIVLAIVFMLQLNLYMTLIVLLCAPFTYIVAKTITSRSQKYFVAQTKDLGNLNAHTQEMLHGMRTLKAYGQEAHAYEQFHSLNEDLYDSGKNSQFYGSLANPSTRLVTNISYTIVGVCGALLAIFDFLTIGNISSFLIYSNTFSKPFNEISGVMTQLQAATASAQRIFALFDFEEEENSSTITLSKVQGHIQFDHVQFGYVPNKPLMKDLSLDIPAGSRIAIVGRTGAGKTTLINLLMRFYELDRGTIKIDGIDITSIKRETLRTEFGMVLQDTYLFDDTIHNIIAYGMPQATREEVIQAAKKTGAHQFIEQLSDGYDTWISSNSSHLSQGQRQLLSITRVMIMNPSILILDEATSNIDTRSEQHVTQAMELLMKGKTSFVIAHRLSTIIHSDQILVMEQGNIIEQGTHEQLLKQHGAYATLYHSQFAPSSNDS